jgi:hypothetical protein
MFGAVLFFQGSYFIPPLVRHQLIASTITLRFGANAGSPGTALVFLSLRG